MLSRDRARSAAVRAAITAADPAEQAEQAEQARMTWYLALTIGHHLP